MRRSIHQLYFISVIIFICTSAQGNYPSDQSGEDSVPPDGLFPDPGRAVLSMDIKDEPLKKVLERITDQNGITFLLPPSLAEEKVMMRFSNLTLVEGLNKILSPYNRIFIYREPQSPSESSVASLKEVRIFPHTYEGRVKEPLMTIAEGTSESKGAALSEGKKKDRAASRDDGRRAETYVETLTTTLKGRDREAKLDAVQVLRNAGTVDAVRALSVAMRDRDPQVKNEAVSALQGIGKEIVDEGEVDPFPDGGDVDGDDTGDLPPEADDNGPQPALHVASSSGDSTSIALTNEDPVRGVQFTLNGVSPSEVRTTSRTEGFLATFNNNKIILVSISGKTIAPGSGPVVEVVGSSGSSARLSGVVIGK
jgi:hypothetical protein